MKLQLQYYARRHWKYSHRTYSNFQYTKNPMKLQLLRKVLLKLQPKKLLQLLLHKKHNETTIITQGATETTA